VTGWFKLGHAECAIVKSGGIEALHYPDTPSCCHQAPPGRPRAFTSSALAPQLRPSAGRARRASEPDSACHDSRHRVIWSDPDCDYSDQLDGRARAPVPKRLRRRPRRCSKTGVRVWRSTEAGEQRRQRASRNEEGEGRPSDALCTIPHCWHPQSGWQEDLTQPPAIKVNASNASVGAMGTTDGATSLNPPVISPGGSIPARNSAGRNRSTNEEPFRPKIVRSMVSLATRMFLTSNQRQPRESSAGAATHRLPRRPGAARSESWDRIGGWIGRERREVPSAMSSQGKRV